MNEKLNTELIAFAKDFLGYESAWKQSKNLVTALVDEFKITPSEASGIISNLLLETNIGIQMNISVEGTYIRRIFNGKGNSKTNDQHVN